MNGMSKPTEIPPSFPRPAPGGAVPGVQPKLLVRRDGASFVAGPTEQEVRDRYDMCEDLAHQLVAYIVRKRAESPEQSAPQLHDKVTQSFRKKAFGWGLSPGETEWVLDRTAALVLLEAASGNK